MAQHIMRAHDWVLQSKLVAKEIMNIDQQIIAADLRKATAELELSNHRKQIEQAQKVEETMRGKYTNQELYTWMIGQISTVYFQSYQLAYDVAKRAERAFRYELGLDDSSFIQFGYWDSLKKGLLAGDRLLHDLKRMEVAYLNQNKREYELTKHVSLRQLDPAALLALKATGSCEVTLPEWLFDLDTPGHHMRRIKNVSLSIPAVAGPYTNVNCTLSLLKSTLRRSPALRGGEYKRATDEEDTRFVDYYGTIQSIVTSNAQNDSGLFETNLRDERFLPFEGAGAMSTWRLELPAEFRQFDYNTISDVIVHLRYTARQGGAPLRQAAVERVAELVEQADTSGLVQLFSLRHDFSAEWQRFLGSDQDFTATVKKEYFPYFIQDSDVTIEAVELYAIQDDALVAEDGALDLGALSGALNDSGEFALTLPEGSLVERDKDARVFVVFHYTLQ